MPSPFDDDAQDEFEDDAVEVLGELTVTMPQAAPRLDKALAAAVPEGAELSRSRLMKMIEAGDVWRGGVPVTDAKAKVQAGDVITLRLRM